MAWTVLFVREFQAEYEAMPEAARCVLIATKRILRELGPNAKRPHVDTVNGSDYANMKELRFHTAEGGERRAAFAFDSKQQATVLVLVCGDKAGAVQADFYKWLIKVADERYAGYLAWLKSEAVKEKAAPKRPKK